MIKFTFVSRYFNMKGNLEIVVNFVLKTNEEIQITLKCGERDLEEQIKKRFPQHSEECCVILIKSDGKNLKSYAKKHIDIRYLIYKNCFQKFYNENFYRIELEISEIYDNFKKSIPHPFNKILDD